MGKELGNGFKMTNDIIPRNILDGELLGTFLMMSSSERQELCRKIGATADTILDDIMEIERVTSHF